MSFVWDSNILRHYLEDHPLLLENLTKVPRQHVVLLIVVRCEVGNGPTEPRRATPTTIDFPILPRKSPLL
jgi:hypothetical protein